MTASDFHVEQIDHVELFVPDPHEAAQWYERVLGLEPYRDYEQWAEEGGPLMISSDGGNTMLALFEGEPRGSRETVGHHRVAFRVDGSGFLRFLDRLEDVPVVDDDGQTVSRDDVVDHDLSLSIYFCDPYGNRYEVTSYDYERVASVLE